MMLWHHLKKRLVEVSISFPVEHRHVHLHFLVGGWVRDLFRRSVVPAFQPAAHLLDLLLLIRDHLAREIAQFGSCRLSTGEFRHLNPAAMMLNHLLQETLLELGAFQRLERSIHGIRLPAWVVRKSAAGSDDN